MGKPEVAPQDKADELLNCVTMTMRVSSLKLTHIETDTFLPVVERIGRATGGNEWD